MATHIFKPGDMAVITACAIDPSVIGMQCIVESNEYAQKICRPGGSIYTIIAVDITIPHPTIKVANVLCIRYLPPEEWPESVFKERELNTPVGEPA